MTAAEPRGVGLAEFLLERIAEDEGAARIHDGESPTWRGGRWPESLVVPPGTRVWRTFDPARVLAECAAKRRIVEEHSYIDPDGGDWSDPACRLPDYDHLGREWKGFCATLRALASVYADHPDHRPEWA